MNGRRIGLALRVALIALSSAVAGRGVADMQDPPWNVKPVGQIGGYCPAVEVVGHYAYIGEGPNLTILDVSNPASPVPVGRLCLGEFFLSDIQVKDNLAYIAGLNGYRDVSALLIVDVTNPRVPRLRASYTIPAYAHGVYVTDGLAYVAYCDPEFHHQGGVQILDVSNPSSPTLRGSFSFSSAGFAWKVYVNGGFAYLAGGAGLYILDVTNPSSPRRLGYYIADCNDVFVSGGLAYVAQQYGLEIVDVTSPTAPTRRGRLLAPMGQGLSLSGGLLYLAQWTAQPTFPSGRLAIIDVTNPSSPTLRASCPTSGPASAVVLSGGMAYLADGGGGLSIVDVRNPSRPTLRSSYDTLSDASDVHVEGGVAYVANGVRGLKTIDVSNPSSPRILGTLRTPGIADKMTLSGKMAYLVGGPIGGSIPIYHSLQIVDVTNPSLPRLRGFYAVPGHTKDVAVSDGLAYIANHRDGIRIVDVTNPSSPTLCGLFDTPGIAYDVAVSGGLAYIADFSNFRIVDVRNPASPVLRSSLSGCWAEHVFLCNGIAYVVAESTTSYNKLITCIDVTNPDAPRILSSYSLPTDWDAGDFYVANARAYTVMEGLRIVDVRDPWRPKACGFYPSGAYGVLYGCGVFASGQWVYVTDPGGLRIFQYTGPTQATPRWNLYR